ncbi:phosphatidate cytidylyltransferase [Aeromicrobium tamlense]|uniref:Phosphatidate cytidylyltransferase n=1 Tax=Aeromicrobium tamlense TaxID=375541 RepID=A0A8I0FUZ6_9ACTN|nr:MULTISPECIES: phosphatidate cytidylyltransferase [Aeromicrobium]MBD1271052.1 phosphatidate cytidylyltransferase [Aeromicrobium tamlense]NYI38443.1 phosphatidate cytidylyltransferase [Aeromicrobium tamlense]
MTSEGPTPDSAAAKKTGRAGRDLRAAITVGVSLVALVLLSLFWVKDLFGVVAAVALVVAALEIARALGTAGIRVPLPPVLVGGVAMLVVAFYDDMDTAAAVMALTVIATMAWRLRSGSDGFVRDATAGVFLLSYLFLMGTFVMRMLAADDGPWRVVAFILVTIASDIGGYAAGVLFGKHPMAPTISPKKSWEGFAGSLLAGIACGILVVVYALEGPWWAGLLLGVAGVCFATLGDLCESLIKRDLGIKDMGDLLPGHGGLMDRLDSLIAVAPVAYLVMYLLV